MPYGKGLVNQALPPFVHSRSQQYKSTVTNCRMEESFFGLDLDAMKLVPTRRTDYGLRALIFLAQQSDGSARASEIAPAMGIPMGFLHQVLQELQRAGLVSSRPGRTGGYALARPPRTIRIREIVEALEGPIEAGQCALRGGPCHWDDVCALHWVWSSATQAMAAQLDRATLAQVAADDQALAAGTKEIPSDAHRRPCRAEAAEPKRSRRDRRPA